jgi:hypothetical protein
VPIKACTRNPCIEAARNVGAGRLVFGSIERYDDRTYFELDIVGLANMSFTHFGMKGGDDPDHYFRDDDSDSVSLANSIKP